MRVSDAVIQRMAAHDISIVFGIPGKQTLPLNEAIDGTDGIRFVMARHETAVSHQAWGYAETSGTLAATLVVPGPGDMNAMNGLKNALNDNVPILHLSVETDPEIRGGDGIHETPPETYDTVVKENILVETPEAAPLEIERAISLAMTPPRGPVRVGIPKGFLSRNIETVDIGSISTEYITSVPSSSIGRAATLLSDAEEPVIIAGGGVRASGGAESLHTIAEWLDAPVLTTYKGKGTFPDDHDLSAGMFFFASPPATHTLLESADVVLAIGTDFDAVTTMQWSAPMPDTLIHITLSPDDLGFGYTPTVGVIGDADDCMRSILDIVPTDHPRRPANGASRAQEVREAQRKQMAELVTIESPPLPSAAALTHIRDVLPRETIISADAGGFRIWTLLTFEAYHERTYVNPGSWATMGTGLPAAIGSQLANPDSPVVALTGDGGLMMAVHELHTAVAEALPITVIVFRNNDYAIISDDAIKNYSVDDGRYDWPHAPISFVELAESMGMTAVAASTPEEIRSAVIDAVSSDQPRLVEIPTDPTEPQAGEWMQE